VEQLDINQKFAPDQENYYKKVLGGWLGKTVGGTLGAPYEGQKELLKLSFYNPVPQGGVPNDDLDLQLVWLDALKRHGPDLDANILAEKWLAHITYPFDEYGVAIANLKSGLTPPISGFYNNPFHDCMGSPIRSEIWAFISPGNPLKAIEYAWQDAIVDHAFEGVWGEVFLAAVESMAFVESEAEALIEYGLAAIPGDCRVSRAVQDTIKWYHQGLPWQETRERILQYHGHHNFTDCPQNIAFIILGWLYGGGDFGKSITAAVNCGYDTDCTGATLGAILGVIAGADGIPKKWLEPIGHEIVTGGIVGIKTPATVEELARSTCNLGKAGDGTSTLEGIRAEAELLAQKYLPTKAYFPGAAVVDYHDHPVWTGQPKEITIHVGGNTCEIPLLPGRWWQLERGGDTIPWLTVDGNLRLDKIAEQKFRLSSWLWFDKEQKALLVVDVDGQVKVKVNSQELLSYHQHEKFLPAPHRAYSWSREKVVWKRGWNRIEIEVCRCCADCALGGWLQVAGLDYHILNPRFPQSPQELKALEGKAEIKWEVAQ
jgi:ADP-ribosylglycohydrolase